MVLEAGRAIVSWSAMGKLLLVLPVIRLIERARNHPVGLVVNVGSEEVHVASSSLPPAGLMPEDVLGRGPTSICEPPKPSLGVSTEVKYWPRLP